MTYKYTDNQGRLHREDGPAIEYANGYKAWYRNGKLHREDEPAVIYANGNKYWYLNGKRHRKDGPAIEYASGAKSWYLNGQEYSKAEYGLHHQAVSPLEKQAAETGSAHDSKEYKLSIKQYGNLRFEILDII
jgi:hypothetical protein